LERSSAKGRRSSGSRKHCPKANFPIALKHRNQIKSKTLDAETSLDDAAGDVNSDEIDDFVFAGYRLAVVFYCNQFPLDRGQGGRSGSEEGAR